MACSATPRRSDSPWCWSCSTRIPCAGVPGSARRAGGAPLEKWPFVLTAAACCVLAYLAKGRSVRPLADFGPETRVAQAAYGTVFYLARTFVPHGLHAHHPLASNLHLAEPVFLVSLVLACPLTILAIGGRRQWPGFAAAWMSYLAILAPNSGLVTFGTQLVADRYSYLSTIPWTILAAGLLARVTDRHGRLVLAVAVPLLLSLGALSRSQCRTWRDSTSCGPTSWPGTIRAPRAAPQSGEPAFPTGAP